MFYAAFRLGMLPGEYLDGQTEAGHLALLAWFGMHRWGDLEYIDESESLEFDWEKHCPQWGDKVAGAKFQISAKQSPEGAGSGRSREDIERAIKAKFAMAKVTFGEGDAPAG